MAYYIKIYVFQITWSETVSEGAFGLDKFISIFLVEFLLSESNKVSEI